MSARSHRLSASLGRPVARRGLERGRAGGRWPQSRFQAPMDPFPHRKRRPKHEPRALCIPRTEPCSAEGAACSSGATVHGSTGLPAPFLLFLTVGDWYGTPTPLHAAASLHAPRLAMLEWRSGHSRSKRPTTICERDWHKSQVVLWWCWPFHCLSSGLPSDQFSFPRQSFPTRSPG